MLHEREKKMNHLKAVTTKVRGFFFFITQKKNHVNHSQNDFSLAIFFSRQKTCVCLLFEATVE